MKATFLLILAAWVVCGPSSTALSQGQPRSSHPAGQERLTLTHAVTCEGVKDFAPLNPGVVFPTSIGKVLCFTHFDPVPQKTVIYHNWFHRDEISNKQRLVLQTPRWSCFSSIQLRESDKGPWRVEVTDSTGRLLRVLRFSVTD
ncbi:MAG: DUF2914 domain-containing protein [Thermodesulfobacteriota bacterium]